MRPTLIAQYAVNENTEFSDVSVAARMFQLMKYSNKDFLRAISIVVGWDPIVSSQVFKSTL